MSFDLIDKFRDPLWRVANLYKIINKQSQLVNLIPNPVQKQINLCDAKRKAILKARQFGVTTNELIKLLDCAVWGKNINIAILAHKREAIQQIFNIVRTGYNSMPDPLKPELAKGGGSQYKLEFPKRNTKIYVSLDIRGGTNHYLHISEAAFIPKDRLDATLETVPLDGHITYETTANGLNHFYDLWVEGSGKYKKHFYPWYFSEEYRIPSSRLIWTDSELDLADKAKRLFNIDITDEHIAFRRFKITDLKGKFLQEYPEDDQTCFLTSGNNPFDIIDIKRKHDTAPDPIKVIEGIKIFKEPVLDKTYVIGADVAEGVKSDYSTASVMCVDDREDVAFFRSNELKPGEFADKLLQIGKLYSRRGKYPLLAVERNNHGHAVLLKLNETHNYPGLWLDEDEKLGHLTSSRSRPLLIDSYIEAIEDNFFKVNSKDILAECLTLIDNNGKIEAESGKHDDAFIAGAIAAKICLQFLPKINIYKASRILV